jgi:hypothetical protein
MRHAFQHLEVFTCFAELARLGIDETLVANCFCDAYGIIRRLRAFLCFAEES